MMLQIPLHIRESFKNLRQYRERWVAICFLADCSHLSLQPVETITKESKSNKNADSYLPHGNTILVAPPGGQSVMDINAD